MPQSIEVEGQGVLEFPDEMSDDDIKGVIKNKFYATPTPPVAQTNEVVPENPILNAIRGGAETAMKAAPEVLKGLQTAQQAVINPLSFAAKSFTPEPVEKFMQTPLVPPSVVEPVVQAAQYPTQTLGSLLFGEKFQSPVPVADKFVSEQIAAQTTPENLMLIAGTEGLGAAERVAAKRAPKLAETLFGTREKPDIVTATNESLAQLERQQPPPVPEAVAPPTHTSQISTAPPDARTFISQRMSEGATREQALGEWQQASREHTSKIDKGLPEGSQVKTEDGVFELESDGMWRATESGGGRGVLIGHPVGDILRIGSGVEGKALPTGPESVAPVTAEPPPKIVAAAIQDSGTGKTFTGPSHPQIYDKFSEIKGEPGEAFMGEGWNTGGNYIDGFVDQNGKFYDRTEAAELAGLKEEASMTELEAVAGKISDKAPYEIKEPSPVSVPTETTTAQPLPKTTEEPPWLANLNKQIQGARGSTKRQLIRLRQQQLSKVQPTTEGVPSASEIAEPTSVTQPEVRTQVGEGAPLRQQRPTTEARQGIEERAQAPENVVEPPPATPAAAAPTAPQPDTVTGIANKVTEQERVRRGLPEASETEKRSWQQAMDEAQARDAEGANLVETLKTNPRALTDTEDALLLREQIKAQQSHDAAVKRVNENPGDEAAKAELEAARDRVQTIYDVDKTVGTETGRGLNARKMLADQDFTLAKMEATVRAEANGGQPLTETQASRISKIHKNIQATDEAYQARIKKGIEDYQKRTGDKDVSPLRPPKQIVTNPETIRLLHQRDKARTAYHEMLASERFKAEPLYKKIAHYTGEAAVGLSRSIKSAYDLSGLLRQGGLIVSGRPITGAKSIPAMLKSFASEGAQFAEHQRIINHEKYDRMRHAKLEITEPGGRLSSREEAFKSELADYIPGVKQSERAYTTVLNKLRADTFDAMTGLFEKWTGRKMTPGEDRIFANAINVGSGRGNMGRFAPAANALAKVFWSPRLAVSRVQWLVGQPLWNNIGKGSFAARAMIATEYGRQIAGIGILAGLAKLAGADIEKDPRSGNFGIRFGNTRLDITAGLKSYINYFSRVLTGKIKTQKGTMAALGEHYGSPDVLSLTGKFASQKLAPAYGSLLNVGMGEQPGGAPTTPINEALGFYAPLSPQDVSDALKTEGVPEKAALSLLAIGGMSVQNYESMSKSQRDTIKKRLESRDKALLRGDIPGAYRLTFPNQSQSELGVSTGRRR